ncbi:hypothetical protein GCM10011502_00700 [Oceanisphaera marina]|uniref:T6SS Phospholipase effector Tle1-like catalytic domain-containing protein n=1 Tax=Oceanisphaera marina TaxID=2017550 RepID=A0ABQ1IAB8_9GAMM|nr:DUF2235 domain-containing protein [Oceanisphaera marina]GGB31593.1 hypothetical protein GCM10011502_00700 [Oceanisphaera marina]
MSYQPQRLVLLFDGTWNDPQNNTNVIKLARSIAPFDGERRQRFFYSPGVGTTDATRLLGGMFGVGLSQNLCLGYDWLARHYQPGDEVWVFGFSRGAYTARSMVGMIRKCGLLRIITPIQLAAAERLYRNKSAAPDDALCRQFRDLYSREIKIHLLGVWDTVGALGIPGTLISERGTYSWHDTKLSKIVERAYQAIALDEHRAVYNTVPWISPNGQKKPEQLAVEQRWFIGAHANVGGGYHNDPLADLPLAWMQQKAMAAGLVLTPVIPAEYAWLSAPHDSFSEFLAGFYRRYRRWFHQGDGRYYRDIFRDNAGNLAVGVSIDPSVWARWQRVDNYRPRSLSNAELLPPTPTPT